MIFDEINEVTTEQAPVQIVQYDRFDVPEHRGFARVIWCEGVRYVVIEGIDEELFEIVLKAK